MAKMIDFNALQHPTLPITLCDENRTVVHVAPPTVGLLDRLYAAVPDLKGVAQQRDGGAVDALYSLIADLISVNDDGYLFTGDQLKREYNMSLYGVAVFVRAYLKYIEEINNAKN